MWGGESPEKVREVRGMRDRFTKGSAATIPKKRPGGGVKRLWSKVSRIEKVGSQAEVEGRGTQSTRMMRRQGKDRRTLWFLRRGASIGEFTWRRGCAAQNARGIKKTTGAGKIGETLLG